MNLQQVCYFVAVVREQNFTRAAKKCGVRQPSLSNGIARLEAAIGGDLLIRSSPVRPTELGTTLLPLLIGMVQLEQRVHRLAAQHMVKRANAKKFQPNPRGSEPTNCERRHNHAQ
jgi:DNA-binding transcriptional LysR family regulator